MSQKFTLPPEWAEQSAIQLTWPHKGTDWAEYLDDINATYIEMAKAISSRQKLLVVTPYKQAVENLLQNCLDERQMNNIILHECPTNDTWARDHGFITLTNNNGAYETTGFVPNVVFPCATLQDPDTGRIAIYYGAADTNVGLAFTNVDEIVTYIKEHSDLQWGDDIPDVDY